MMTALDAAIKRALDLSGTPEAANRVYLEFIKANFIIPIEKHIEEPTALYFTENNQFYMPAFTDMHHLDQWAIPVKDDIACLTLSGVDLLKGMSPGVSLCLNLGAPSYKAFFPEEIARMQGMIGRWLQS